jgi:FkbM family methyltransferase
MHAIAKRVHPQRIRRTLAAASCVHESARFAGRELRDVPMTCEYRLRRSGLLAQVRHPLIDMWVVEELFRFRIYKPPARVTSLLETVNRPIQILDLGGYVGLFGLYMRELFPDADVVSLEPDPYNARLMKRCIERNHLGERWRVVEACAATRDGTVDFTSNFSLSRMAAESNNGIEEMRRRITGAFPFMEGAALLESEDLRVASRDVFPFLANADLVKIDIEGAEWEILADPRLADLEAVALVLEYHPVYTPH